jgi:hypothetical protein
MPASAIRPGPVPGDDVDDQRDERGCSRDRRDDADVADRHRAVEAREAGQLRDPRGRRPQHLAGVGKRLARDERQRHHDGQPRRLRGDQQREHVVAPALDPGEEVRAAPGEAGGECEGDGGHEADHDHVRRAAPPRAFTASFV